MNIVFTVGSLSGGGAERVVARLASQLVDWGHNVSVLLIASNEIGYKIDNRVNVKYINPQCSIKGLRFFHRGMLYRKEISEINPDVVISFTVGVNLFALLFLLGSKYDVIISERNDPYVDPKGKLSRILRNILYRFADGVVFQTLDAQNFFPNRIKKKSTIIINPIDNILPKPSSKNREKNIVAVGRLEVQKNHALLIDAFSEIANDIPEYKLSIYGKGTLKDNLQSQIISLGMQERITLMGYCDNVLNEIVHSSIFVLPSNYEGISNSLLEAMAIGLPIISTDHPIGGARQLIKSGVNGILVDVGDKDGLKEAIIKLINTPSLAEILSVEATKVKQIASIDIITQKWIDFIESVIYNNKN